MAGQQLQLLEEGSLLVANGHAARGPTGLQRRQHRLHDREQGLGLLVVAARLLGGGVDAALQALEVGQHQLGLDGVGVADGIDIALDMRDFALETAEHVDDGVDLADVGEELVAEPFALAGAAHQAGDVDEAELGRHDLRRLGKAGEHLQPLVGHGDAADVRLDGAERVVGRLRRRRRRQRVEERRLADVRQPDDAAFEAHGSALGGQHSAISFWRTRVGVCWLLTAVC